MLVNGKKTTTLFLIPFTSKPAIEQGKLELCVKHGMSHTQGIAIYNSMNNTDCGCVREIHETLKIYIH